MRRLAGFIVLVLMNSAHAEYRVYQYYIKSKTENVNSPNAQLVTSTLDPVSYAAYHGGKLTLDINLLRSWICLGNTSKKEICTISDGREFKEVQKENLKEAQAI